MQASFDLTKHQPAASWGTLPPRMRVLFVTTYHRTGGWLAEALATDSGSDVVLEESIGGAAGMARLRDDAFDAVLVTHEPPDLDALEMVEALRGGGSDEPILLLGIAGEQELTALAYEVGADAYLCVNTTTTRTLLWSAARAIERHQLLRENRRLLQAERQRLQHEHDEANRLLAQQRALLNDLESLATGKTARPDHDVVKSPIHSPLASSPATDAILLPEKLVAHYSELLRAYVVMGSGNLTTEMSALAELLVSAGVTPQQAMLLHLKVLEELIHGLGSRSARHVMNRADLLVLEVMVHLADGYRGRYFERLNPPRQLEMAF